MEIGEYTCKFLGTSSGTFASNMKNHGFKYTLPRAPGEMQRFSYGSGVGARFSIEENVGTNASREARDIAQYKGNRLQHDGITGGVRC